MCVCVCSFIEYAKTQSLSLSHIHTLTYTHTHTHSVPVYYGCALRSFSTTLPFGGSHLADYLHSLISQVMLVCISVCVCVCVFVFVFVLVFDSSTLGGRRRERCSDFIF